MGRVQIMPSGTPNQIHKAKQPQQILPKPFLLNRSPQKHSVSRLNTAMPQQTPLLINQPQTQNPTLLLNQVLTSGAPVLVQPAGTGGTVHLMLRTPTPTLQSGPGPPQNKMIIANTAPSQPQATVLIQNRQQVVRFMSAQGPMQLQQIQTPSGPQFIAIPQSQALSFPTNSVLVQGPAPNTLQIQQNSGNALQLRQSPSTILQPNSFPQNSLQNQISLQNQMFQPNTTIPNSPGIKRDDKNTTDNALCMPGATEQKKSVIDNKNNAKKNVNVVVSNINSNFTNGNDSNSDSSSSSSSSGCSSNINLNSNILSNITSGSSNATKKNNKTCKMKTEDDILNKNAGFPKIDNVINSVPTPTSTAQKNITSSLRRVRPVVIGNRNKQNQNTETKEKPEELNFKGGNNSNRVIDCAASNSEHLISPSKVDNLTATINSVAENAKSPISDHFLPNLSINDVFMSGKSLNLNKRPNLTIVQKQPKPETEEPNSSINRLILSPNSTSAVNFENISDNYENLELSGVATSTEIRESESPEFVLEHNPSSQELFQNNDETKKSKRKTYSRKKGKKEENRVDLWDLMKSAGIGDDEFDEPTDVNNFSQDTNTITESLEVAASDSDILAQLQTASQVPEGVRVVVGEDGRPVIINGNNVLIPQSVQNSGATGEPTDTEAVLQNMILPDNLFNFTPQAFATAQTQLNQLIQDHGGIATSSADQQLLSQIFGATSNSISNKTSNVPTSSTSVIPSVAAPVHSNTPSQTLPSSTNENMMVKMGSNSGEVSQPALIQKPEAKTEFIGGPPPGLPPLGPDSLVITNNNGVPTLVASPALMQYLQTHQGIIQFQHDPVTKTIQPSLIIPHPQHKIEATHAPATDTRADKTSVGVVTNTARPPIVQIKECSKPQNDLKTGVSTTTDDPKNILNNVLNALDSNDTVLNAAKVNMVKFVKDNPPLLQVATEINNLTTYKQRNKTLTDKEVIEIDKKIQQNRAILDQCFVMENNRDVVQNSANVSVKDANNKEDSRNQIGTLETLDKLSIVNSKTTETQTLEDLQNLDMTLIKGFHPPSNTNSPTPNSDFQAKFLESIGMANKPVTPKTVTNCASVTPPVPTHSTTAKRSRKKKDKVQATQGDGKTEVPSLTFNIAELTPEQNVRLNQALQNRGVAVNQFDNLDAIKQIIQEEVRKITSNSIQNANIRFTNASNLRVEDQDPPGSNISKGNMMINNPNLNQLLDQQSSQGNIISLQGNELVAINSGNQSIFTPPNQILSGNHFVSSNNQILAIGGNHNQLVSLGNPINSSNQIVTLGGSPGLMSMGGSNIATPGAVIVGSNGNVIALLHQNGPSGQSPGIVQRVQTIQLTTPKQQHFKTIQNQIQTLSSKINRTPAEQSTLQKLILEQQKILSSGKLVQTFPGQSVQGMQIVSQPVTNSTRIYQAQPTLQQHSQLTQNLSQPQQCIQQQASQTFIATSANLNLQTSKANFTTQTLVSCGTNTPDFNSSSNPSFQSNIPKMSVPPTVLIADVPTSNYGPLYVSPNTSGKNVTKCEKGTSPIQIQMGTQTVTSMEYRNGKMSTGTMTSPNTGKPQAVVAPAIVIQQTESQSPTYQLKPRNPTTVSEPVRTQVPALSRTAFIEQQMRTDQAGATMPDTRTPFLSKSDACKRLIRYHVMDEKSLSPQDLATADDIFEATAQHLLDKFKAMKEKYKYLLMLESMREVSTAERIMVDRNFIIEERIELEELREKEKRLQEEFENPTTTYPNNTEPAVIKTELTNLDETKLEVNNLISPDDIKIEKLDDENNAMISKNKSSDINSDSLKYNPFKLTEANRNLDLSKIKSETKECKNTRTFGEESIFEEDSFHISSKCKAKSSRTFSDGSSKSSLDSSRDEDSGTDINAQVQSAIDSILNLQKCETMSDSPEDSFIGKRSKKKRKLGDKFSENSKRLKIKGFGCKKEKSSSEDSEDDNGSSDADPILDEAIRSILTS